MSSIGVPFAPGVRTMLGVMPRAGGSNTWPDCRISLRRHNWRRSRAGSSSPRDRCGTPTASTTSSIFARTCCIAWCSARSAEVVRKTIGGNGTTFDLQGRLINCEGDGRMVTRLERERHGDDAGRSVRGQAAEPTERRDLPFERFAVFHRSWLSRADGRARAGRRGVPHRAGRGGQPGGAGRVSERSRAVAGRADALHREHALVPVHPRGGAGCERATWCGGGCSPTCRPMARMACPTA